MIIISMVSGKGGVGKTASSVNLAAGLADVGYKVLLIDLDKQANSTKHLKAYDLNDYSVCNIFLDKVSPHKVIKETHIKGLDIIPANYNLEDVPDKILLDINRSREGRLKEILSLNYDFAIIDCPPSLDIITVNALVISNYVMVPIKIDMWGLEGFEKITNKVAIVREEYNPKLTLLGCFVTMDNRTTVNKKIKNQLVINLKDKFFKTSIRQGVTYVKSTFKYNPVILENPGCNVSVDYKNLVQIYSVDN